ncbi:hypothetical protein Q2T41_06120 [Maribacter confluentis]|uniref:Uncharacterized protein n=1 Tax=Maribacter confluentis TaxID=1656093 RepID=A0ABT8RMV3_9FLAO|nr:hypothetical protein [Maribacter confluentis]MDO1512228.1 hypothetical protein [Maribacter confluentis]
MVRKKMVSKLNTMNTPQDMGVPTKMSTTNNTLIINSQKPLLCK